jgi:hypothetical protein
VIARLRLDLTRTFRLAALTVTLTLAAGCGAAADRSGTAVLETQAPAYRPTAREAAFLDTLQLRTFRWFWDLADPVTRLTPDRAPTQSFASVAASGFALTAYGIGAEHGWVTRADARRRVVETLRFFLAAKQDTARAGVTGHRGFFYHFLDMGTGHRFEQVELSTIDTALLLAGALFCQSYFDGPHPEERRIRVQVDSLMAAVDWNWAMVRPGLISHGWDPENGFLEWDWGAYNESMLMPLLALGSTTHVVGPEVWPRWVRGSTWGTFHGLAHVGFPPLFGHQYTQVWWDLRGIQDSTMRAHGIDWFENSRRATLAQRAYAIENPGGFRGYGERLWGLTACDGPLNDTVRVEGRVRRFATYDARGASYVGVNDDGTVSPTAAGGSVAFAPEVVVPMLLALRQDWGDHAFNQYGFVDALNPTLDVAMKTQHGTIVPGVGWFDGDQLGIDQGPILAMIENYRTGLVWNTMRKNAYVIRGLKRAGFTGGWIDRAGGR